MRDSLTDAALGRVPCDLIVKGAQWFDVFAGRFERGDLAVHQGRIVGSSRGGESLGLKARETVDARDRWLVPGFIDAHVHVESSLLVPGAFQQSVLPRGTTSAVCDPHELANVLGLPGIRYFLESADRLDLDLWVMLSSCVPATKLETNGGGTLRASDLLPLRAHRRALGLAEMMNMPGVLSGDPDVLEKLEAFADARIDGHAPLLRGLELSAYAAAGISSCHESSQLDEAREKLSKGIAVWIREGSVAKDLEALAPLLDIASSAAVGFCTDDRNPLDIAVEGHVDHLVRGAIRAGVAPEAAYRASSWSVARHYGLDQGARRVGALAPGYRADLVLLGDLRGCAVTRVWKGGRDVASIEQPKPVHADLKNTVRAKLPSAESLLGPKGRVHVIEVLEGKIITGRSVDASDAPGVARLTVLERHGRGGAPANAYVRGFGPGLRGAIASSVGHDSHNLIVTGSDPDDMRTALAALIECGGGFCVAQGGRVLERLELPFGGLMSERPAGELKARLEALKRASRAIGCELSEPFLQLAFLSLPVIPSLKLTDQGLIDVERFEKIAVGA
jgi:adenine deaminase